MKHLVVVMVALLTGHLAFATEYHVAVHGNDANDGSLQKPFRTISAAANVALPGDVVTVHEGTYRERINPPRGGESDSQRIVFRAAPGEKVEIKGSELVKHWVEVKDSALVDEVALKATGAFGVVRSGKVVQVVVGPEADTLAQDIEDLR